MKGHITPKLAKALRDRDRSIPLCKGWNFHAYSLGADRCCICGHKRYEQDRAP